MTENTHVFVFVLFFLFGFLSIQKYSKEVKVAVVFYIVTDLLDRHPLRHSEFHLASTGAVRAVFWRLTEGGAVSVDRGEQHRPRGEAQTVAFGQRTQI